MDYLLQRIKYLELQVGAGESALVEDIALLQAKLLQLYEASPELYILNQLQSEFPSATQNDTTNVSGDVKEDARRQELISIKYAEVAETLRNAAELQAVQFSEILGEMCQALDVNVIMDRKNKLTQIAKNYHLLTIKALVVIRQYELMIARENRFWLAYQKRLDAANARLGAAERKNKAMNEY